MNEADKSVSKPKEWVVGERNALSRGSKFDRYIIVDLLHMGALGAVYRAYDSILNRGVALNVFTVALPQAYIDSLGLK